MKNKYKVPSGQPAGATSAPALHSTSYCIFDTFSHVALPPHWRPHILPAAHTLHTHTTLHRWCTAHTWGGLLCAWLGGLPRSGCVSTFDGGVLGSVESPPSLCRSGRSSWGGSEPPNEYIVDFGRMLISPPPTCTFTLILLPVCYILRFQYDPCQLKMLVLV